MLLRSHDWQPLSLIYLSNQYFCGNKAKPPNTIVQTVIPPTAGITPNQDPTFRSREYHKLQRPAFLSEVRDDRSRSRSYSNSGPSPAIFSETSHVPFFSNPCSCQSRVLRGSQALASNSNIKDLTCMLHDYRPYLRSASYLPKNT